MASLGNFAAGAGNNSFFPLLKPEQLSPTAPIFGEKIISVIFKVRVRFHCYFSVTI